jgi:catechol 2,3-dioxygenase-like lactoylglutathione lyase family enzyme
MSQTIGYVTLVVRDYDEAIAFFTQSLGFNLIEDTPSKDRQGRDKR